MHNSRITKLLNIEYPIIQAPMTWLTSAELVAAVSNAGGLGVLGPHAGRREASSDPVEVAEQLRAEIRKTKNLTNKPFAVNYILPKRAMKSANGYSERLYQVICEEKVGVVVTIGYDHLDGEKEIRGFKSAGIIVIHRNISPTVKSSLHSEKLGVDALVVTGHEAGGHLSRHKISTVTLLPQVTEVLKIPVIAGGGIYNSKGAKAVFAMGAEGVFMGTRFINTLENPASDVCKNEIIRVSSEELVEIKTAIGSIRATSMISDEATQNIINGFRVGMLEGDLTKGFICVSTSAGGINNILSSQQVVDEVVAAFN